MFRSPEIQFNSLQFLGSSSFRVEPNSQNRWSSSSPAQSPEAALADLRRIQRHTVNIDSGAPIHGVSTVQPRQAAVLAALRIKKPTLDTQLSML